MSQNNDHILSISKMLGNFAAEQDSWWSGNQLIEDGWNSFSSAVDTSKIGGKPHVTSK